VIRSHYGKGFLKQYVRDPLCLRTEPATNDVTDHGVKKAVENLPQLPDKLATICDNYLTAQKAILETFVDQGQLRKHHASRWQTNSRLETGQPTTTCAHVRPGKVAHIAARSSFATAELYPCVLAALQMSADQYSLASLRYDLSKLRAKTSVEKFQSRRYVSVHSGIAFVSCFSNSSNSFTTARRWVTPTLRR
jgi:hypothetical protein